MTYLLHCQVCDILYEDVTFRDHQICPVCGQKLIEKKGSYPEYEDEQDAKEPLFFR